MEHYAGIDVSLEQSSVCVVDGTGRIVREARVASEPEALVRFLGQLGLVVTRIGVEAGPLSQWLYAGLAQGWGMRSYFWETRHVKAALSAMIVKTDRRDARGIAELLRMGWFRPVHCKSPPRRKSERCSSLASSCRPRCATWSSVPLRGSSARLRSQGRRDSQQGAASPGGCGRWWRVT